MHRRRSRISAPPPVQTPRCWLAIIHRPYVRVSGSVRRRTGFLKTGQSPLEMGLGKRPMRADLRSLVVQYRAEKFPTSAASTQANWGPWLDRIAQHVGDLNIRAVRTPGEDHAAYHSVAQQAETPRTADYGLGVLSPSCHTPWILRKARGQSLRGHQAVLPIRDDLDRR